MANQSLDAVKRRYGIIGDSPELERAIDVALQVASTDLSVLIIGESGVGKENFPQIIHQNSKRKHGPYFAINCGSIPEGTIDSELFGHEKGSFTGALTTRKGYFEAADKGTLFLDEVAELPLSTQARLLRVLETGEFIKVGSSKVDKTDVRVVAATNVNIIEAVEKGKFREDLYYRLNSVPIRIPALRDRKEDIPLLFRKFSSDFSEKYTMPSLSLTASAKEMLKKYRFPGNVRQLKNITEQIAIIEQERIITPEILRNYLPENEVGMLPIPVSSIEDSDRRNFTTERELLYQILFDMRSDIMELKRVVRDLIASERNSEDKVEISQLPVLKKDSKINLPSRYSDNLQHAKAEAEDSEYEETSASLEDVEKEMIIKAMQKHDGKRKLVADDLRISPRTLYRKLKEYGLDY